ncbi:hypothetical protein OTU49_017473 [Cherax quadricarinatus]|uniref:Uncharacterized protein n=2 Tax=Cherax quadricarinatus TaxID=27406 RepID=A0AAW0WB54_CHEQU
MWAVHLVGVSGLVGVAVGGTRLAATQAADLNQGNIGKQFYGSNGYGISNTIPQGYSNKVIPQLGYSVSNSKLQSPSDYNLPLQKHGLSFSKYGSSSHNSKESYGSPASYATGTVSANKSDSSPALSALALLGFLYFLNLIQDVLQKNSGRRRRSLHPGKVHLEDEEEEEPYSTSYVEGKQLSNDTQQNVYGVSAHVHQDYAGDYEDRMLKSSKVAPRYFSFLENFFIKLPRMLGLRPWQSVDRDGRDDNLKGMGGYITSRLKMISSIMSFLQNPSPARVRRAAQAESEAESFLSGEELNATRDDVVSNKREKRHTHFMNAWYGDLEGENNEVSLGLGNMVEKIMSLMSGGRKLQEIVKADSLPTLLELTRSLDGSHPQCLQHVLCQLNSHSNQLPFLSRITIKLLSANLAEISTSMSVGDDNQQAIVAGQRGEDCDEVFTGCDIMSTTKKK